MWSSGGFQRRGHRFTTATDTEDHRAPLPRNAASGASRSPGHVRDCVVGRAFGALLLARDRVARTGFTTLGLAHGLAFASELRALSVDPEVRRDLNPEALDAFLSLQYVPTPLTIFKGVRKLPAGHFLRCSTERQRHAAGVLGRLVRRCTRRRPRLARESSVSGLEEAVRIRLRSRVPIGAFLERRSRFRATVVAFMAAQLPIRFITSPPPSTNPPTTSATRPVVWRSVRLRAPRAGHAARNLARLAGCGLAGRLDEPFADPAAIPNYLMAEAARRTCQGGAVGRWGRRAVCRVLAPCAGADERRLRALGPVATTIVPALAPWLAPPGRRAGLARLGMPISQAYAWKHSGIFFDAPQKPVLFSGLARPAASSIRWRASAECCRSLFRQRSCEQGPLRRFQDVTRGRYSREGGPDEHGARPGSPVAAAQSEDRRARRARSSRTQAAARPRQAPAGAGMSPIDCHASVVNRPKHGLTTPIGQWLRDEWREMAEDCLFGQQAVARDLFNARFLALALDHASGWGRIPCSTALDARHPRAVASRVSLPDRAVDQRLSAEPPRSS